MKLMKRYKAAREIHPLAQAVKDLFDAHKPKREPFQYKVGDQVQVRLLDGLEWIGEVCYRTRDLWGGGGNVYEVTNSPDGLSRGVWLPPVHEYEMALVAGAPHSGFELFDKVKVEHPTRGIWIGHVLSFVKDNEKNVYTYEVEGAPDGLVKGRFEPLAEESHLTMITPAFAEYQSNDWD